MHMWCLSLEWPEEAHVLNVLSSAAVTVIHEAGLSWREHNLAAGLSRFLPSLWFETLPDFCKRWGDSSIFLLPWCTKIPLKLWTKTKLSVLLFYPLFGAYWCKCNKYLKGKHVSENKKCPNVHATNELFHQNILNLKKLKLAISSKRK